MPNVHTRQTQEYEVTPHSKANQKKEYQKAYQKEYYKRKKDQKEYCKSQNIEGQKTLMQAWERPWRP